MNREKEMCTGALPMHLLMLVCVCIYVWFGLVWFGLVSLFNNKG